MRKVHVLLLTVALVLSLISCSAPSETSIPPKDNVSSVAADWIMFDTLSSINDSADCTIIAKVLTKENAISVGYDESDFANFANYIESDSLLASKMQLSIRTPHTIVVEEVISSKLDISEGDVLDLYQIGGTLYDVTLTDSTTVPLEIGTKYVLILKQRVTSDSTSYYSMITPIQGYAEIVENDTNARRNDITYQTHEQNHLFDSISSVADIYDAVKND